MSRIGRVLAVLVVGWVVLFAPATAVASEFSASADAGTRSGGPVEVLAQQPAQQPAEQLPERQRFAIGVTGVVLIGAVLLSRKMRKKPVFWIQWKK